MVRNAVWVACALLALAGCNDDEETTSEPPDLSPLGGDRPVAPIAPTTFDPTEPTPVVILLHGFGASGLTNDLILGLEDRVEDQRFILLLPDGTIDSQGRKFWNATDHCCDFDDSGVDDVAYIEGLIEELRGRFTISRVGLIGHSNGGYMTHRYACDRPETFDAFASLAGGTWYNADDCQPSAPVAALQIHGSEDPDVLIDGDEPTPERGGYPSAAETVGRWAAYNDCDPAPSPTTNADFTPDIEGDETQVTTYLGCREGGGAELWAMMGAGHLPAVNDAWRDAVLMHLLER